MKPLTVNLSRRLLLPVDSFGAASPTLSGEVDVVLRVTYPRYDRHIYYYAGSRGVGLNYTFPGDYVDRGKSSDAPFLISIEISRTHGVQVIARRIDT